MTDFPVAGDAGALWPQTGVGARTKPTPHPEPLYRRVFASIGFMLDAFRRRRAGRLAMWTLVLALGGSGIYLIAYPVLTDFWAHRIQGTLETQFAHEAPDPGFNQRVFKEGDPLTRLRIPKLHVNVIVVEGWSGNALRAGAGHLPGTALPGSPTGNVAIAGHRTGFGEPFRHLDQLRPGDNVILESPVGKFLYRVMEPFDGHSNPWITNPIDIDVAGNTPFAVVTLVTCDPPHTSKRRLIVRARLVGPA